MQVEVLNNSIGDTEIILQSLSLVELVDAILAKALELELIKQRDRIYLQNQFYNQFGLGHEEQLVIDQNLLGGCSLIAIVDEFINQLTVEQQQKIGATRQQQECYLIDLLLPFPSVIEQKFTNMVEQWGIKVALNWYHRLNQQTNYIKTGDIARNQTWNSCTKYGDLVITINLSKPEKDPLEIARLKQRGDTLKSAYPKCLLCIENEGYAGGLNSPPRNNHRMITLSLNHQEWLFQYSPYAYFSEHSIIINPQHRDMIIDQNTFINLFDFVDKVPHYIIGSNSDIPIVGGSILNHDHYQAGNYIFPIEFAKVKQQVIIKGDSSVEVNHLSWPLTTLQLIGGRRELISLAMNILNGWCVYSNDEIGVLANSDATCHNGINPIVRKLSADKYVLYIILRNNRTTMEFPEGIFHSHREFHHIKKENIGLIEAMGLAILPGRLKLELSELEKLLLINDYSRAYEYLQLNERLLKHQDWLTELYSKYKVFNQAGIAQIIKDELANKYVEILECCGVFKQQPHHDSILSSFISGCL